MRIDTSEIEKKSLEAHVELCAERYKFLEEKLQSVDEKMTDVATNIADLKSTVSAMATKHTDRLINWGIGIIVFLVSTVGYLLSHYVIK